MTKSLAVTLKKYVPLGDNSYKILVAYYSDPKDIESLSEHDFSEKVCNLFDNKVQFVESSLREYSAISGSTPYKTCIVKAMVNTIPLSASNINQITASHSLKAVANNLFVDERSNTMWKKVTTDTGITHLVQTCSDDMDELLHSKLDIRQAVAFSQPLYPLDSDQYDYVMFYNPNSQRVESGFQVQDREGIKTIASRQQLSLVEVPSHCIVVAATASDLVEKFKQDLSGDKGSLDVRKAYINFFFKAIEGDELADKIEKQLHKEVLKSTASLAGSAFSAEEARDIRQATANSINKSKTNKRLSLKEVEAVVKTKFNPLKNMASYSYVAQDPKNPTIFSIKLQKPSVSIDEISYCLSRVKEVFNVEGSLRTSKEFASIDISL